MKYFRKLEGGKVVVTDEKGSEVLRIEEVIEGKKAFFKIIGELRSELACELEDELTAAMTVCKDIRIDLSEMIFIAGAGLKNMLRIQKETERTEDMTFVICGLSDKVKEIFDENGFLDLFEIELEGKE